MVLGDENFIIVANRDESSVEHPARRPRKGYTVTYGIRHWLDMRSLNFGTAASIA